MVAIVVAIVVDLASISVDDISLAEEVWGIISVEEVIELDGVVDNIPESVDLGDSVVDGGIDVRSDIVDVEIDVRSDIIDAISISSVNHSHSKISCISW